MANHHFVPRGILRNWQFDASRRRIDGEPTQPQMRVWVLDKRNRAFAPKAISTILCEPDANTVAEPKDPAVLGRLSEILANVRGNGDGGYDPEETEHVLGGLDARVATLVRDTLILRLPMEPDHLDALVAFAFQLRMRGPTWREHHEPDQLEASRLTRALPGLSAEDHRHLEEREPHLRSLGLVAFPPLERGRANRARGLRVSMLVSPPGTGFVTCDNPARPFVLGDLENSFSSRLPGLNTPGASVTTPLTPDLCAFISLFDFFPDGEYVAVNADAVRRINTALLIAAETRVVTPRDSLDLFEPWASRKFSRGRLRALSGP